MESERITFLKHELEKAKQANFIYSVADVDDDDDEIRQLNAKIDELKATNQNNFGSNPHN